MLLHQLLQKQKKSLAGAEAIEKVAVGDVLFGGFGLFPKKHLP